MGWWVAEKGAPLAYVGPTEINEEAAKRATENASRPLGAHGCTREFLTRQVSVRRRQQARRLAHAVLGSQWLSVLLLAGQVALVRRLVRAGPFKARASEPSAPFGGALLLL